jgi:hypothetical protein
VFCLQEAKETIYKQILQGWAAVGLLVLSEDKLRLADVLPVPIPEKEVKRRPLPRAGISNSACKEMPLVKWEGPVHVISTREESVRAAREIWDVANSDNSDETLLGFDVETAPIRRGLYAPPALIQVSSTAVKVQDQSSVRILCDSTCFAQIATSRAVYLFQVHLFALDARPIDKWRVAFGPLRQIISSTRIRKCGPHARRLMNILKRVLPEIHCGCAAVFLHASQHCHLTNFSSLLNRCKFGDFVLPCMCLCYGVSSVSRP